MNHYCASAVTYGWCQLRAAEMRLQTPLPGGGVSGAGLKATTGVTQGRLIVHLAGSMFLLGWRNVPRLPTFLLSPFACWLQLTPVPEWSLTADITINTGHGDTCPRGRLGAVGHL